jgi:hypothetical protein
MTATKGLYCNVCAIFYPGQDVDRCPRCPVVAERVATPIVKPGTVPMTFASTTSGIACGNHACACARGDPTCPHSARVISTDTDPKTPIGKEQRDDNGFVPRDLWDRVIEAIIVAPLRFFGQGLLPIIVSFGSFLQFTLRCCVMICVISFLMHMVRTPAPATSIKDTCAGPPGAMGPPGPMGSPGPMGPPCECKKEAPPPQLEAPTLYHNCVILPKEGVRYGTFNISAYNYRLAYQSDNNLVLYASNGVAIHASGTNNNKEAVAGLIRDAKTGWSIDGKRIADEGMQNALCLYLNGIVLTEQLDVSSLQN